VKDLHGGTRGPDVVRHFVLGRVSAAHHVMPSIRSKPIVCVQGDRSCKQAVKCLVYSLRVKRQYAIVSPTAYWTERVGNPDRVMLGEKHGEIESCDDR